MELTNLRFSLEKKMSEKGNPYVCLEILNVETGEVERIFDKKVIQTIKSMLLEL